MFAADSKIKDVLRSDFFHSCACTIVLVSREMKYDFFSQAPVELGGGFCRAFTISGVYV